MKYEEQYRAALQQFKEKNATLIARALAILKPQPAQREECIEDIRDACNFIEIYAHDWALNSKRVRQAVEDYLQALKCIKQLGKQAPWAPWPLGPEKFIDRVGKEIAAAEEFLKAPKPPRHRTAYRQRAAAQQARNLLEKYGQKPTTTRGRPLHKLSPLLYAGSLNDGAGLRRGDPLPDLYRHLRQTRTEQI
jgi:hypothetical protein